MLFGQQHWSISPSFVAGSLCVQQFSTEPKYTEVNPNANARMECVVDNIGGDCRWQKDGKVKSPGKVPVLSEASFHHCENPFLCEYTVFWTSIEVKSVPPAFREGGVKALPAGGIQLLKLFGREGKFLLKVSLER